MLESLLESLTFNRLRLKVMPARNVQLPPFLGSTLRGAFGAALRHLSCNRMDQRCIDCLLANHCAYAALYERSATFAHNDLSTPRRMPPPMVIEPPPIGSGQFKKDLPVDFTILLFGPATTFVNHALLAVERMCHHGLGADRVRFTFSSALEDSTGTPFVLWENGCNRPPVQLPRTTIGGVLGKTDAVDSVKVTMETPLRFATDGVTEIPVTFRSFARSLLARSSAFCNPAEAQNIAVVAKEMIALADSVKVVENTQRRTGITRWSNRQKRHHDLIGATGHVIWQGEGVRQMWPLIRAGEILHVGKATTFGFGKYGVA